MKHLGTILAGLMLLAMPFIWLAAKEEGKDLRWRLEQEQAARRDLEQRQREELANLERRIEEAQKAGEAETRRLREELLKTQSERDRALAQVKALKDDNDRLKGDLAKAQAAAAEQAVAAAAPVTPGEGAKETPDPAKAANDPGTASEAVMRMLNSPAMQAQIQTQAERTLDRQWQAFLSRLDPALREQFRKKMLDQQSGDRENAMALISASPEERKKRITQLIENAGIGDKVKEGELLTLLGPQNYEQYREYKNTLPARQELQQFEDNGFKLQDEAKNEQLVNIMQETIKNNYGSTGASPKSLPEIMKARNESRQVFLDRAAPLLNDTEKASLKAAVDQRQKMESIFMPQIPATGLVAP